MKVWNIPSLVGFGRMSPLVRPTSNGIVYCVPQGGLHERYAHCKDCAGRTHICICTTIIIKRSFLDLIQPTPFLTRITILLRHSLPFYMTTMSEGYLHNTQAQCQWYWLDTHLWQQISYISCVSAYVFIQTNRPHIAPVCSDVTIIQPHLWVPGYCSSHLHQWYCPKQFANILPQFTYLAMLPFR